MALRMTRIWIAVLGIGLLLASQVYAADAPVLQTQKDKISYGIGVEVGGNFKRLGIDIDVDLLMKGLRDSYTGQPLLLTATELGRLMDVYYNEIKQKNALALKTTAENNKKAGDAFLADNKKKPDVMTLPSGLQYKILKAGNGKKPTDADMVEVNYRGTLIDGTEFDSSYPSGQPALFKISGVIAGWQEALKLMPVGSKWQLFIPSELAYGPRPAGRNIGPNATLIFDVELVNIK